MSMTKLTRLGAVLTVLGLSGAVFAHTASAEGDSSFTVVGRADALAVEYVNTAAPVFGQNAVIYGTPASAQSLVDSVGQSVAFASAPYPGEIMAGLPDNGNGVVAGFGGPTAVPSYPFYVQSQWPIRPSAEQDQTGNHLRAHSDQHASASQARSGLIPGDVIAATQGQASSRAAVDTPAGTMTATADSRLDAFKVTDKLQIGKSASHAKIVAEPGKPIVKESSFTVGSIVVNGVEVGVTDHGFKLGDQSPPGADPSPVFAPLAQAGISVEFLPATGTDSSIESAGLRITQVREVGGQTQRVTLILGRVSTRVEGTAAPATDSVLAPTPADGPSSAHDFQAGPTPASAGTVAPAELPTPAATTDVTDLLPSTEGSGPSDQVAAPSPADSPTGARAAGLVTPRGARRAIPIGAGWGLGRNDVRGFYFPLCIAGVLMLFTPRLIRTLGLDASLRTAPAPTGGANSVVKLPNQ